MEVGSAHYARHRTGITNVEKREALQDDLLHEFTAAEIGALAHLYRGEVYRSTIWRTRLDNTTNWAVAALGLAMSASFAHPEASPLPLLLIGILIVVFMTFEARRYRYFNVWRARARWIETNFFAPMLQGHGCNLGKGWERILAKDYIEPRHHISMARAIGRRLRRTYFWLLTIQALAYLGKIAIHPTPVASLAEFVQRASIGPIPGELVLLGGLIFNGAWLVFALVTFHFDRVAHGKGKRVSMG
jgi:uncharacterized membrane protein